MRQFFVAFLLLIAASCILPSPEMRHPGSRGKNIIERAGFINAGVTSKEEILLQLGEPDAVGSDETKFLYWVAMEKGIWAIGGGYGGSVAQGPLTLDVYLLTIEFDMKNIVARYELKTKTSHFAARWGAVPLVAEETKNWMPQK